MALPDDADHPAMGPSRHRLQALLSLARGDEVSGRTLLEQSIEQARASSVPYEEAISLRLLGRLTDDQVAEEQAAEILERMGQAARSGWLFPGPEGGHDLVDGWPVVWSGTGVDPRQPAISPDHDVAAELSRVGIGPFEAMAFVEEFNVLPGRFPAPDPPKRAPTEAERPVELALLVSDHDEWVGEAASIAGQHPRVGEGHDHDVGVAEFVSSSAHGVDMCFARQSSQVAMKDQHQRIS